MGRTGIRYEDVEQAAEALARTHVNPTHERIRHALGGGSFSTIGRHLQTWRLARDEPGEAQEAIPPDSLVEAVKGVWQGMRGAAQARIAQIESQTTQALAQARATAEMEQQALRAELAQRMSACVAQAQEDIRLAQKEAEIQRHAATRLQEELCAANERLEQTRQALGQADVACAEAKGRAEACATEAVILRSNHERAVQRLVVVQQQATEHLNQLASQHADHLQAREVAWAGQRQHDAAQAAARLQELEAQRQKAVAAWEGMVAQHRQLAAAAAADKLADQTNIETLRVQIAEMKLRLAASEAARAAAVAAHKDAKGALDVLRGDAQGRVKIIEELREAFNTLVGEQLLTQGPQK